MNLYVCVQLSLTLCLASLLEKSMSNTINGTKLDNETSYSSSNHSVSIVTEDAALRMAKKLTLKIREDDDNADDEKEKESTNERKVKPNDDWNVSSTIKPLTLATQASLTRPVRPSSSTIRSVPDVKSAANSVLEELIINRLTGGNHKKYPNHYAVYRHQGEPNKRQSYSINEDYEQQVPDYSPPQMYEYDESYNTIPEDQSNNNNAGYEGIAPQDPYRITYTSQDPGYFGPPIAPTNPVYVQPPAVTTKPEKVRQNRQGCDAGGDLWAIIQALGANIWALIQLVATSSLPFIIPILAVKIILVALTLLKFLKLIKLFVKIFIILPFFIRVVYPAFSSSFNLQNFIYQKIQDLTPSFADDDSHHPQLHQHPLIQHLSHSNEEESRDDNNATSTLSTENIYLRNDNSIWDLRKCPDRVACELGAFLSGSTRGEKFPKGILNYLERKANNAEGIEIGAIPEDDEDDDSVEKKIEKEQVFKAFVVALGKAWTQKQCAEIYKCSVLF